MPVDGGPAAGREGRGAGARRPLLDPARRGRVVRPAERPPARGARGPARRPAPPRPLPLGARGRRAAGAVRHRAGPGARAGDPPARRRRGGPGRSRAPGRLRLFRYEVRCWRDGSIPDVAEAVESPRRLTDDATMATGCSGSCRGADPRVGARRAGRRGHVELQLGDRLAARPRRAPSAAVAPPAGGRAPGWDAGIAAAHRDLEASGLDRGAAAIPAADRTAGSRGARLTLRGRDGTVLVGDGAQRRPEAAMTDLTGRAVLVTGAARGIGAGWPMAVVDEARCRPRAVRHRPPGADTAAHLAAGAAPS